MAKVLRVLLYRNEIDLACYLTAHYELSLNIESDFNLAIKYKRYEWLKYVYAFKKNFDGDPFSSKDGKTR